MRRLVDEWTAECNEESPSPGPTAVSFYDFWQKFLLHRVFLSVKGDENRCFLGSHSHSSQLSPKWCEVNYSEHGKTAL